MASQEIEALAAEIFKVDSNIVHQGLIDLQGNLLLDQSSAASKPTEPDADRIEFYKQLDVRRHSREDFDEAYGKTDYVHIIREKMQQMILYLPMITVYLTLDTSITPDDAKVAAQKIKFLAGQFLANEIKS